MTLENFIKETKSYLVKKGCSIHSYTSYLSNGGLIKECEFTYQSKDYRLTLDRYNRWTIYEHEPYPVEMKHYERILKGNQVHCGIHKDIGESLDKFFQNK